MVSSTQLCDNTQNETINTLTLETNPTRPLPKTTLIVPDEPFKAEPTLRNRLARTKLKPIHKEVDKQTTTDLQTDLTQTMPNMSLSTENTTTITTITLDTSYPFHLFNTSQKKLQKPNQMMSSECTLCKHNTNKHILLSTP